MLNMNAQRLTNSTMEIDPVEILNELNKEFPNELRIAILTVQNRKLQELLDDTDSE